MKNDLYKKVLSGIFCLNAVAVAQTVWTDSDFITPKGHTWINPGNPQYGGDVYIQNTNPAEFSDNMAGKPNTGVLSIEYGGKLTADGEVIVEQTGPTTGDAVLVTDGGNAHFNGGLTATIKNINNAYYVVASSKANSQLHVTGDTNIFSEFEKGYGLYLGEGTTNSFNKDSSNNGILNISTGMRGIHSIGNTDFNQEVHIGLNANGATGVLTYDTASPSLSNFNDKVYITNNSVSNNTSSAYGIAVNNANGIININDGAVINFGDTYTNGNEIGLYSAKGTLNVQGDLSVKTNSGNTQAALYATNNGKINVWNSVVDFEGDIISNNGAGITMNINDGSKWEGASYIMNSSTTDISMSGTTWLMTENSTITNLELTGNSAVYLNSDPVSGTFTPKTLTIANNFNGDNSTIIFNTQLEDDNSLTDRLVIQGDTSGSTKVQVRNAGGMGAGTIKGIELISVGGNSNGKFIQDGRIVAGAYDYFLNRGDGVVTDLSNWYLTSRIPPVPPMPPIPPIPPVDPPEPVPVPVEPLTPAGTDDFDDIIRPEAGSYIANNSAVNTMFLNRLHDRLGETQYTDSLLGNGQVSSIWVRAIGGSNTFKDTSGQLRTKGESYVFQTGSDIAQWSTDNMNRYHLGIMGGYGFNHNWTKSKVTDYSSKGEVEGFNVGVYGTWYSNKEDKSGLYVDSWLTYSWFDNKVHGEGLEEEKYTSNGLTASIESGYTFKIENNGDSYFLQPKAQVVYMGVKTDDYTESNGTVVEFSGDGNIQTRLGVRAYAPLGKNENQVFQPFVEINWIHNKEDFGVTMDGVSDKKAENRDLAELKLGTEVELNKNLDLWANGSYGWGGHENKDYQVTVGLKYRF